MDLLENAQEECTRLRKASTRSSYSRLAVVHAFADGPYDRSSFHVAGSSTLVASLASHIAVKAVTSLSSLRRQEAAAATQADVTPQMDSRHPTVGIVDHVAVLPLSEERVDEASILSLEDWNKDFQADTGFIDLDLQSPTNFPPTGWVARTIGHFLKQEGVQVFWYGHADSNETALAQVRKEKTRFFDALPSIPSEAGQATVGAPPSFVENYNIQVATRDKKQAQALTKWVRSRDGGLPFVEALTLPYVTVAGADADKEPVPVYEVACNLLNPSVTSTRHIDARVEQWKAQNYQKDCLEVRSSYRVGTTSEMCLKVLEETGTEQGEREHNQKVRDALKGFLTRSLESKTTDE